MNRLLLLAFLLCLPGLAWGDTCTFNTSTDWTSVIAATTPPTCDAGAWSADDHIVIASGITVTCTGKITQTLGAAPANGIVGPGKLVMTEDCIIRAGPVGYSGLDVDSNGARWSKTAEDFVTSVATDPYPPDRTQYQLEVGDLYYCAGIHNVPGADTLINDCGNNGATDAGEDYSIGICYPDAEYKNGALSGEMEWDLLLTDVQTELTAGNEVALWFEDWSNGAAPPRDVNVPYRVYKVLNTAGTRCLLLDLRQGCSPDLQADCPRDPIAVGVWANGHTERTVSDGVGTAASNGLPTLTAAANAGDTSVTVDTWAIPNNNTPNYRGGRFLTLRDPTRGSIASPVFPGPQVGILATADGGGGADTLTLEPGGIPANAAYIATEPVAIDYGWRRGDTYWIGVFPTLSSGTDSSATNRRDSPFTMSGAGILNANMLIFDGLGKTGGNTVQLANTAGNNTIRHGWQRDAAGPAGGACVRWGWQPASAINGNVLRSIAITGSDLDTDGCHTMSWGLFSSVVASGTVDNLTIRHSGDDAIIPTDSVGEMQGAVTFNKLRVEYMSGSGNSANAIALPGSEGIGQTFTVNGGLFVDAVGAQFDLQAAPPLSDLTSNLFGTVPESLLTLNRVAVLANFGGDGLVGANGAQTRGDRIRFRDAYVNTYTLYLDTVSQNVGVGPNWAEDAIFKNLQCGGAQDSCSMTRTITGASKTFDVTHYVRTAFYGNGAADALDDSFYLGTCDAEDCLIEDVAIIDFQVPAGIGRLYKCSQGTLAQVNNVIIRRFMFGWTDDTINLVSRIWDPEFGACDWTPNFLKFFYDGMGIFNGGAAATLAWAPTPNAAPNRTEPTYTSGVCFYNNLTDMGGGLRGNMDTEQPGLIQGNHPPAVRDWNRKDFRIVPGSHWDQFNCGPRAYGPKQGNWGLAVRGVRDPTLESLWTSRSGGGGGNRLEIPF